MTPSELKYNVEQAGISPHFFTRKTMSFFGDTMRNYGVCSALVETFDGAHVNVWELYRKHAVKGNLKSSVYFDKLTFRRIHATRQIE